MSNLAVLYNHLETGMTHLFADKMPPFVLTKVSPFEWKTVLIRRDSTLFDCYFIGRLENLPLMGGANLDRIGQRDNTAAE